MRIGIMLRHLDERGGITVYSRNIVRSLLDLPSPHEFVLLVAHESQRAATAGFPRATTEVVHAPGRLAWDQVSVPRAARRLGLDVIFNPKLSVPLAAACPTVLTLHGLEQFAERRLFRPADRLYVRAAMPVFCRRAGAVIVMTETGRRDLRRYLNVPERKIHVIPESFNERCAPVSDAAERGRVLRKYVLPERYILFLGGVTPLKNLPTLLRAFALLRERDGDERKLVLAGFRRWRFNRELAVATQLGLDRAVREIGFVDDEDLPALYSLADAFVLPSFYEGFGIPILEAQACGCPVVVSTGGAMPEVAGGGALTFDPRDPAHLADALNRVFRDPGLRARLVDEGLRNAARYRWRQTAEQTLRLFEGLARE